MARPRSARAHAAVLDAALRLFADRGIDATSVDAIAEASGVSKATIYKHWPDKEALCVEVMAHVVGRDAPAADFDSDDLRADLVAVLSHQPPEQHADLRNRLMPHLLAYSARNPAFGQTWRARILEPPRAQLRHVLERGIARGELPATLDIDLAIMLLHGPMMYAHMLSLMKRKAPDNLYELVVDAFIRSSGTAVRKAPGHLRRARRRGLPKDTDIGAGRRGA
jgi:AcrR family transcriptional regulator